MTLRTALRRPAAWCGTTVPALVVAIRRPPRCAVAGSSEGAQQPATCGRGDASPPECHWLYPQEAPLERERCGSSTGAAGSVVRGGKAEFRSKTGVAQVNELLCKVLCHNLCCVIQSIYDLGIEPGFATD
jgi:hypothetical protein